jgi:cytochrome c oxidase cbb3-type subunit 1
MYPSLWFVFAGIVFFPWIFASASMTLWATTMRGSVLPVIAAWAANNIVTLWLGSIALGAIYYFIPKISGKALYSHGLAVFAFWLYILFGQSAHMHATAAFPSWIVSLSELCTMLLVLPAIANAMNWYSTLQGRKNQDDIAFKFTWWAAALYVVGSIVAAIAAFRPVNLFLEFTLFQTGLSSLTLLGFVTLSFFGAFAYIIPRIVDVNLGDSLRIHYLFSLSGALLTIVGLLIGGLIQAGKATDAHLEYINIVRSGVMPAGLAIIGFLLMLLGQLSWLWNVKGAWCACCCAPENEGGRR